MFDSAWPLISTFTKIARTSGQPPDKPNWHHFSISERIHFLQKCEADRSWILQHDRKIKKSLMIYLLGMLCIFAASYYLNFGEPSRRLNAQILEKLSISDLIEHTDNPNIFIGLGDFYYNSQHYAKAITAYDHALTLVPDSAHALNNLAWLFATSEDASHRNHAKALDLALRAAEIERKPHILDTLAECYYVNGQFDAAIVTAIEALEKASDNREYFEEQLQKFEGALVGE
jgi:tetratricopeptide (TPR) repeat protein